MNKKNKTSLNRRPSNELCKTCVNAGGCIAKTGERSYQCPRLVHKHLFDANGKLIA